VCAEVQAHGFLVREQTRCKRMGGGRGGRFIQSDEVNAGRDHATREGPAMMTTSPSEERER